MYAFIRVFRDDLPTYTPEQLTRIAKPGGWSLGQLYDHLNAVAFEYLGRVAACASAIEPQPAGKTAGGEAVFSSGAFPPIRIKLPDTPEFTPSNACRKEELIVELDCVERDMLAWEPLLGAIDPRMKELHEGFGWLNAREWFDLIGMHFVHHLRQKAELESLISP